MVERASQSRGASGGGVEKAGKWGADLLGTRWDTSATGKWTNGGVLLRIRGWWAGVERRVWGLCRGDYTPAESLGGKECLPLSQSAVGEEPWGRERLLGFLFLKIF